MGGDNKAKHIGRHAGLIAMKWRNRTNGEVGLPVREIIIERIILRFM